MDATFSGRTLQEGIAEHLLRGVRVDVALRHFGGWLAVPDGSLAALSAEEDLALSQVSKKLDDFLSHDWKTGRWPKFAALCVVYNGDAALAASCLCALLFTALMNRPLEVFPRTSSLTVQDGRLQVRTLTPPWPLMISAAIFWLVLIFGQRLRGLAGRPRLMFFDRLCINQLDDEEKREGISSLAGFMRSSDRLVVLWSPRYFTRLWCVYEMATWMHLGNDLTASMCFMPVSFAMGLLVLNTAVLVHFLLNGFARLLGALEAVTLLIGVLILHMLSPWMVQALRQLGREMHQLGPQLAEFSIHHARCFCCSQAHADPATGDRLPCDRVLVHNTLHARHRQSHPDASLDDALDRFDILIRTTLKEVVCEAFGTVHVGYRQALFMSAPVAWWFPNMCASLDQVDTLRGVSHAARYASLFLCVFPVGLKFMLAFTIWSVTKCIPGKYCALETLICLSLTALIVGVVALLWVPALYAQTLTNTTPSFVVLAVHVALTVICFWRPARWCGGRRGPGHLPEVSSPLERPPSVVTAVDIADIN